LRPNRGIGLATGLHLIPPAFKKAQALKHQEKGTLRVLRSHKQDMRMKRYILGVAAALCLAAGPAAADGLPSKSHVKAPHTAVGPNWNGFYIGAGIGAGSVTHDTSVSVSDYGIPIRSSSEGGDGGSFELFGLNGVGGQGAFGTITIGYDRVIRPGWVLGVFADYDFGSSISTDVSLFGFGASIDQNYTWAVGARLGFLANPGTLIYGTAGYTETEFDFLGLKTQDFGGYFVGAGIETFLRDNVTLKLEYRYAQFDSENLLPDFLPIGLDVEPTMHTARLVLSYKFSHRD
jgi:outer membrane immunogenic protein